MSNVLRRVTNLRLDGPHKHEQQSLQPQARIVLSFDVEEHYRIEAATGLDIDTDLKAHYRRRLDVSTRSLLDLLAERDIKATFFIVGKIAEHHASLVKRIHAAGHEVASHSWEHLRVHHFTPATFAEDVRRSKDALEQVTGEQVVGFRAPTFSIVSQTQWAIDVLADMGFLYDSSIYPVWHDRYGVPRAPRRPFLVKGNRHQLLEIPPATLRFLGNNLPVGGGGYFRLLPLFFTRMAIRQLRRGKFPQVVMLYFHPWEFDPAQARLPLQRLNQFRTYVGIPNNTKKLVDLLESRAFVRARDVAQWLSTQASQLRTYSLHSKVARSSD